MEIRERNEENLENKGWNAGSQLENAGNLSGNDENMGNQCGDAQNQVRNLDIAVGIT